MNSTVSMNLSVIFKLRGVNFTISGACASGSHAIGHGLSANQVRIARVYSCGGAQEVNPFSVGSFDGLSAFSTREISLSKHPDPLIKAETDLCPAEVAPA